MLFKVLRAVIIKGLLMLTYLNPEINYRLLQEYLHYVCVFYHLATATVSNGFLRWWLGFL